MLASKCGVRSVFIVNAKRSTSSQIASFSSDASTLSSMTEGMNEVGSNFDKTKLISDRLESVLDSTREWPWNQRLLEQIKHIKSDVQQAERDQMVFVGGRRSMTNGIDRLEHCRDQLGEVRGMLLNMSNGDSSKELTDITEDISACMTSIEAELSAAKRLPIVEKELDMMKSESAEFVRLLDQTQLEKAYLAKEKEDLMQELDKAMLKVAEFEAKDEFNTKNKKEEKHEGEGEQSKRRIWGTWAPYIGVLIITVGATVKTLRSPSLRMILPGGIIFHSSPSAMAESSRDKGSITLVEKEKGKNLDELSDEEIANWWSGSRF